jgi:hypothetical protein
MRLAQTKLDHLFEGAGPFRSDKPEFSGQADAFGFSCTGAGDCGATLAQAGEDAVLTTSTPLGIHELVRLPRAAPARFVYRGSTGVFEAWPPAGPRQTLRAIELISAPAAAPLVVERLSREEPMSCDFDAVAQDCR